MPLQEQGFRAARAKDMPNFVEIIVYLGNPQSAVPSGVIQNRVTDMVPLAFFDNVLYIF